MEIQDIIKELHTPSEQITEAQLDNFIKQINSHDRIFTYGTGRSGLMMKCLAMRLMQLGYNSYVVGETTTPSVEKGDLLIVASASGETQSVVNAADSGSKQGADVIVITGTNESSITKKHTPLIRIASDSKYSNEKASIQPLGSMFEQMLLLIFDALVLRMSKVDKKSNDAMAKRHASIE